MNGKKAMLIVDDMEANRVILSVPFSNEYDILTAVNGAEAMAMVRKHADRIAMILTDIIMPQTDGIAFLKWLSQSEYCRLPVIAVTADESCQLEALQNGAWDFIPRPADIRVIEARVKNVLARYALESERKRSEAITKAKLEMDNLVNSIPGGIAVYRVTDHFETLYFSDGVAELSGYTRKEYAQWVEGDAAITVYEEDKRRLWVTALEGLKNTKIIDETYRIYHKNGGLVWVHLNGVVIGEEDGALIVHAVFQKPSKMAQLYDNLVNESKNMIYVSDLENYDLLYVNRTGLQAIGKESGDYSCKKCYQFLFDRTSPCDFCKIHNMTAERFLQRDILYNKTQKMYELRGKLTDWNGIPAHVEYIQDVTEIRQAEQKSEALTHQLRSVMENIPGGMCVYAVDQSGFHPMVHNQAFFETFGYSQEHRREVMNTTDFLNVHPDDLPELQRRVQAAVSTNEKINYTYRVFNDQQKRYIWINLNGVIVPQSDGGKLCYVSYTDVTAERETQQKLSSAQCTLEKLRQQTQNALETYRALVNAVPGGIAQYEICGERVLTRYFSDGICQLTGRTREERAQMSAQDVLSITYREDVAMLSQTIGQAVANRENISVTYRINTKSGIPRWVYLSAAFSEGVNGEILYQAVFTDVDKLKRVEQELQENQLRYEVAIKSSGINIWEYDIQKDSLYVISNSSRIKQNCFHIENYVSSTLNNGYVREDSVERFKNIFERLRRGEKEVTEDVWYKTTDEAGWWCERVTYTTTFDAAGKPVKAFGAGRDVTREKQAEKKFHEEISYRKALQSDNLASIAIDLTENRVMEIDSDLRVVSQLAGSSADTYFEKTASMITGEPTRQQFDRQFNRQALLNRFGSGEFVVSMELTRLYDTNQIFWINFSVHLIQNPETKHVVAHISCVDITQEKVMQTIMETVSRTDYDFFVVVDGSMDSAQGYGVNNHQIFREKGSFEQKIQELILAEVCPEDIERVIAECRIDTAWNHIQNGLTYKFHFSIRTPEGKIRRKQLQFTAINAERKTFLISRIDVNNIYEEQEIAKEKLQRALQDAEQANRVKTDFLSRMSHDIRTPMNAVISLAALGQDSKSVSEAQEYLQKIGASGQYLLAIINDVLSLSKIESRGLELHPEVVKLSTFIQETISIVMPTAEEKQIELQVHQTGITSEYMKLDTTYVRQVAINLLSNAIKFTPRGGTVQLILENVSREGRFVKNRMTVRDNGIGISKKFLPIIFAPFEQENTKNDLARQGTGLGLAIVKSIVEQMNGKIWVTSEEGHGSAFYVEWTLETVPKEEVPRSQPVFSTEKLPSLTGKRILLAEDHPLNTEIAKKLLEKQEMTVEHAANGKLAVAQFVQSPPGYYDAILMDIRMPIMNGLEAAKAIRALDHPDAQTVPIIAMTANVFDEDIRKSLSAGMNAHLAKPIEPQRLYQTLAQCMKKGANE